jgi:uncharacterized protein with NAD-binding domain and iron-sulfur cluster
MPIQYVGYGGAQMLRPPYVAKNVSFYAFLVPAKMAVLQALLDNRLNLPSGREEHFEPAGPFVFFAFNKLDKMYSLNPPDRDKGWFSEQECAVWVRVVDRKRGRSMWFHPYIFVDNSYAMAIGREVYGFPKAIGWFRIPDKPEQASALSMETLTLPIFSPNTQGVRTELIRATKISSPENPLKRFETALEFSEEILGVLAAQQNLLSARVESVVRSLVDLVERKEPMVFLKQFPAPDAPGTACYQAIVENDNQATALHGVALILGKWQIDIAAAASHPIAADLGLSGNSILSALQFWVNFDMTVGLGTNVWTAPVKTVHAQPPPARPKKIAILGGGVGSMATALQLTSAKDWRSQYDITVYQMGWRLGGKGASGRGEHCRIEEHGLHVWLGFYENAFRIIRQVYEENKVNRPPGAPLREWAEAFRKHNFVAVTDSVPAGSASHWEVWPVHFPEVAGTPGDGKPLTLWESFLRWIGWLEEFFRDSYAGSPADAVPLGQIESANTFARSLNTDPWKQTRLDQERLAKLLTEFRESVREVTKPGLDNGVLASRRLFETVDLGVSVAVGLLRGGYLMNPATLDKLDVELQTWLKKQGASPLAYDVHQSALLRALYDLVFAYVNGDPAQPSFEAGVALRCMLFIVGAYKGAIFWKMQAGMGDVVFGPIYQVLKNRGVKFEFFHRVAGLDLNPAGTAVVAIRMDVQATLKNPRTGYAPLLVCENLPSWPAQPLYDQLVQGHALQQGGYDLESFWTTWVNPSTKTLKVGADFDQVVLGISIGALPYLFSELAELPVSFQLMLKNVQTVRTQAMQLWVNRRLDDLGWTQGSVVLDAFANPLNTWAVMDQLIPRENWPAGSVEGIHYFCGPMVGGIPPRQDTHAPAEALALVKAAAGRFIQNDLPFLWPKMNNPALKIVSQYLRANINPTERYVLSLPGSTQYRLRANESGLDNVVLAGDWTNNGFNAGCVEAATMSGIQASNAIQGKPLNSGIDGPVVPQIQRAAAV